MDPTQGLIRDIDQQAMRMALVQAQKAYDQDEVPVGAIITYQNQIIARGHNQVQQLQDATAHAEIICITSASEYLGSRYLDQCTLYVTLEPCIMCAGALYWSQLGKVVYAAPDPKRGFMRYGKEMLHPKTKLAYGLMEEASLKLLKTFFAQKREVHS